MRHLGRVSRGPMRAASSTNYGDIASAVMTVVKGVFDMIVVGSLAGMAKDALGNVVSTTES